MHENSCNATRLYSTADFKPHIIAAARGWLGVPYRHQGASRAGCDCLGLIRGIWRDLYGAEPDSPPPYTSDWGEVDASEPLLRAARQNLIETPINAVGLGSVLLFRMRRGGPCKHLGVMSGPGHLIHAVSGHAVLEAPLAPGLRRRLAHAFEWPSVIRHSETGTGR